MDASLQDLNQKIDLLTAQVSYLSEQAKITERQRQERLELVRDVTPLANQAFSLAVEQLEEVQEYIDLNDLLRLFKRLLRNGRNLEKILDQLESLADLVNTLSPLADEAFGKAVDVMAGLESKGYFTLAQSGGKLLDKTVSSLSNEQLESLGENIGQIFNLMDELIQPEVLNVANDTLREVKQELGKPVDSSILSLARQLRNPDVRKGLGLTLRIMQAIGKQANHEATPQ